MRSALSFDFNLALPLTENLRAGDPCEFRYPARREWQPGEVVRNGGSGWWEVRDLSHSEDAYGEVARSLYIEHVRACGTMPWHA